MILGSSPLGSTSLGGASASNEWVFFGLQDYPAADYEAVVEFNGFSEDGFFSILVIKETETPALVLRPFTSNDPGEIPQSQGVFGGEFLYAQYVVPAARFIRLVAEVSGSDRFSAKGRPGD